MHRPWEYSADIRQYFKDGRITDESLAVRLQDKMAAAYALEELALKKEIPLHEPFQGAKIGAFYVMSPDSNWYVHTLIPDFAKSPEKKQAAEVDVDFIKSLFASVKDAAAGVAESLGYETLREDVSTSAENESSVVLFGVIAERGILLTGDAGVQALTATANYAEANSVSLPEYVKFAQVPHHGSRNNVSPSVLDRLIGPKIYNWPGAPRLTTFVSAAKDSEIHPRKMVINGFLRRGASVMTTKGQSICHHHNMGARDGWDAIESLHFSEEVESWD